LSRKLVVVVRTFGTSFPEFSVIVHRFVILLHLVLGTVVRMVSKKLVPKTSFLETLSL